VNYEPSSLGPDVKRESQAEGYRTFPNPEAGEQLRVRPDAFADHYTQARLFFLSQTEPERDHIIAALIFELSRCDVSRVREAVLSRLIHIDQSLATRVAAGLGLREPITPAPAEVPASQMDLSPALSILAKSAPGLTGRKIAALVTEGVDDALLDVLRTAVEAAGAKLAIVAPTITGVVTAGGTLVPADFRIDGGPSVLFDAIAVLPSDEGGAALALEATAVNFLRDAFAHLKVIAYVPAAAPLFVKGGLADANPDADAGLINLPAKAIADFIAIAQAGRIWAREPLVRKVF
jgi:catalase